MIWIIVLFLTYILAKAASKTIKHLLNKEYLYFALYLPLFLSIFLIKYL